MSFPKRGCAICGVKIRQKERLCAEHQQEWGDHVEEPWLQFLVEDANRVYRADEVSHHRETSLSALERTGQI